MALSLLAGIADIMPQVNKLNILQVQSTSFIHGSNEAPSAVGGATGLR